MYSKLRLAIRSHASTESHFIRGIDWSLSKLIAEVRISGNYSTAPDVQQTASAQIALWDLTPDPVWQKRFYDFNVWTKRKRIEKLRYMHRNAMKRGLVEQRDQWR